MARPSLVSDADLVERLADVFKAEGFEGSSLAELSRASGLQRASLYHRFPGGKEQMAEEVLRVTQAVMQAHVIDMLGQDTSPQERVKELVRQLDAFYNGGRKNCLLNKLVSNAPGEARHNRQIAEMTRGLLAALAKFAEGAGARKDVAASRAERAMTLLEGSLVLCRSLGTTAPFQNMLRQLPGELLGQQES
ncbi:TetR/AcrR family transcriptional regulator [Aestuariivirga litoralis]|uniref:TetR/AcrR family transcriptional regulator n=1 Tax=Aestuariivirga litoralis TaxID=2650924 RepID=UPI0018C6DC74|nr:TetR/AcrR family transcriptional regulator [Aestuariivirga litoralis]MBG1233469.1 TetR/AcrR family transcriptional regulator [Aestuariivirga litoralis]